MSAQKLSAAAAQNQTLALIKDIYHHLFMWCVSKVDKKLGDQSGASDRFIGILDIFGFEIFETNSFEQLCINFTNEKLQLLFNEDVFEAEKAVYDDEGVPLEGIVFPDNRPCCDLLEGIRFQGRFMGVSLTVERRRRILSSFPRIFVFSYSLLSPTSADVLSFFLLLSSFN
jgi:myosin heavy subunit